ncbi:Protein of unknown function [Pyronema omphalodes CBS 100304]|uniref:Uncharacterized protein n=1 Tax=Pyronema omphalodes (strain CBS 100304) TaxID=1076935 RepID=U4L6P7_PYROM|nr:Protein of unknown function [Pyronema omphalodes CBS 100304]
MKTRYTEVGKVFLLAWEIPLREISPEFWVAWVAGRE